MTKWQIVSKTTDETIHQAFEDRLEAWNWAVENQVYASWPWRIVPCGQFPMERPPGD